MRPVVARTATHAGSARLPANRSWAWPAIPDDGGYWEVSRTGDIFAFGNAKSFGDLHGQGVNDVVGIAATAPPLPPEIKAQSAGAAGMRSTALNSAGGATFGVDPTVGRPIPRG